MRCGAAYSHDMQKRLRGPGGATGMALIEDNALGKLSRHEAALMNAFTKTLQTLHFMQSQRASEELAVVDAVALPSNGAGRSTIGFFHVV